MHTPSTKIGLELMKPKPLASDPLSPEQRKQRIADALQRSSRIVELQKEIERLESCNVEPEKIIVEVREFAKGAKELPLAGKECAMFLITGLRSHLAKLNAELDQIAASLP